MFLTVRLCVRLWPIVFAFVYVRISLFRIELSAEPLYTSSFFFFFSIFLLLGLNLHVTNIYFTAQHFAIHRITTFIAAFLLITFISEPLPSNAISTVYSHFRSLIQFHAIFVWATNNVIAVVSVCVCVLQHFAFFMSIHCSVSRFRFTLWIWMYTKDKSRNETFTDTLNISLFFCTG